MQNSIIFILLYLTSFVYSDDSELGKFTMKPGLMSRLWDPQWPDDDVDTWGVAMVTYFRTGKYMDTAKLLGTASGVSDPKINYDANVASTVYGFDIPTDLQDFVITLRGFYKAPASGHAKVSATFNSELDSDGKYRFSNGVVYFNISFGITTSLDGDSATCLDSGRTTQAFFTYMFYNIENTPDQTFTGSTRYEFVEGNLYPISIAISNREPLVDISQFVILIEGVEYPFNEENLFTLDLEDSDWAETDQRMFPRYCPVYTTTTTYTEAQVTETATIATSMATYTDENGSVTTETIYVVATPGEYTASSTEPIVSSTSDVVSSSTDVLE
ncbi:hypothetical protein, no similarity (Partial), partial [Maudiozyma saulgeensis]